MTTCSCRRAWLVDCGVLGAQCGLCLMQNREEFSAALEVHGWSCPVCNRNRSPVVHHDHFADAVSSAVAHPLVDLDDAPTFRDTLICSVCNSLDAVAKVELPRLPAWFSLAPDEMRRVRVDDGRVDVEAVAEIWERKRTTVFVEKLEYLFMRGAGREALRSALRSYVPPGRERSRKMESLADDVSRLAQRDPEFGRQVLAPGNDLALVSTLVSAGWSDGRIGSFVYAYHRKHGNPGLRSRPEEFGKQQYLRWLLLHGKDQIDEANAFRERCAYWRRKRA